MYILHHQRALVMQDWVGLQDLHWKYFLFFYTSRKKIFEPRARRERETTLLQMLRRFGKDFRAHGTVNRVVGLDLLLAAIAGTC